METRYTCAPPGNRQNQENFALVYVKVRKI